MDGSASVTIRRKPVEVWLMWGQRYRTGHPPERGGRVGEATVPLADRLRGAGARHDVQRSIHLSGFLITAPLSTFTPNPSRPDDVPARQYLNLHKPCSSTPRDGTRCPRTITVFICSPDGDLRLFVNEGRKRGRF